MLTPDDEGKPTRAKNRYLILAVAAICFIIAGLAIGCQATSPRPAAGTSSSPTLQINLPATQYPTIPPSAPAFTVLIHSMGGSGTTGTATFQDVSGTVAILLHVDGLPAEEGSEEGIVPVELRYGTCAAPGPLAYPMSVPDAGESETDLPISLSQLNTQRPMAVILYRSIQDRTAIACGDVP